jgi:hypothetical protein
LSVWAKSGGAGAELYANGGAADKKVAIPAGASWSNVMLKGIAVTGGKVEVGVTSNGQTLDVDDFTLIGG